MPAAHVVEGDVLVVSEGGFDVGVAHEELDDFGGDWGDAALGVAVDEEGAEGVAEDVGVDGAGEAEAACAAADGFVGCGFGPGFPVGIEEDAGPGIHGAPGNGEGAVEDGLHVGGDGVVDVVVDFDLGAVDVALGGVDFAESEIDDVGDAPAEDGEAFGE